MGASPFFFGDSKRQLFGAYDEPAGGTAVRDTAVVLAYPAFPEYHKAHWSFRHLAQRLAQEGFFALRFDYFGTGDSAGSSTAGSLDQWVEDIEAAAAEACDLSGARDVSIVGLRLGGTLAAQAVEAGLALRSLVLWDPVVDGEHYMVHLMQRARIQRRVRLLTPRRPSRQLLGYPFPDDLRAAIEGIDMRDLSLDAARRVELISTDDNDDRLQGLFETLQAAGTPSALTSVRSERRDPGGQEVVRMSTEPVDAVIEALLRGEAS